MSIVPTICTYVALPDSHIKSPGNLLKETNKPESNEQKIQRQLKSFQLTNALRPKPLFTRSCFIPGCSETLILANEGCSSSRDWTDITEKKVVDEGTNSTLSKAIKILGLYGIRLNLKSSFEQSNVLNTVLKVLVTEFCFFSEKFVRVLQIKKIVICSPEDFLILSRQYRRPNTFLFPIRISETEDNIAKTLYKAFLAQLLCLQPTILEEWSCIRLFCAHFEVESESDMKSLEYFYIALMQNINSMRVKSQTDKLKKLLIQRFPEEFSNEWFKNRNREKKRSYRVHFRSDCSMGASSSWLS